MVLPNLLVIGAQRSGTTSAYRYLSEHPEVFMSDPKEPHFLAFEGHPTTFAGPGDHYLNGNVVTDQAAYEGLFASAGTARWRGEASAMYLYLHEAAIAGIQRHLTDPFLIVCLRQPADRAYSSYEYLRRQGREPIESFEAALAAEDERRAAGWAPMWHYRAVSRYADQVEAYVDAFGAERLHVILQEDMDRDPQGVFRRLFEQLDIDPEAPIDFEQQHNRSGAPKSARLDKVLLRPGPTLKKLKAALPAPLRDAVQRGVVKVRERNIAPPPGLSPQLRAQLTAELEPDIVRLEALLDLDLAGWR